MAFDTEAIPHGWTVTTRGPKPENCSRGTRQAQAQVVALLEIIGNARLLPVHVKMLAFGAAICQAFHLRAHCIPYAMQNLP